MIPKLLKEIWLCAQSTFLKFVGTMAKKAFIEGPLHSPQLLSFLLKKRRVSGHQPLSRDQQQKQLHLSGVDANFDPDNEWKELKEKESIKTSQLKIRFEALLNIHSYLLVCHNATSPERRICIHHKWICQNHVWGIQQSVAVSLAISNEPGFCQAIVSI